MKEENNILEDTTKVTDESGDTSVDTEKSDAAVVATESKNDPTAKLRAAGDTIIRAEADAESFKRRREESGVSDVSDDDKKRAEERKRIEDEAKKRESAAEEKRAALEYAESYRDRIRTERETAAAKKKEEDKERARAEEKMAREREISEGIEREREAAKERGARAESLLEKVSGDVGSAAKKDTVTEASTAEKKEEVTTEPAAVTEGDPEAKSDDVDTEVKTASSTEETVVTSTDDPSKVEEDKTEKTELHTEGEVTESEVALDPTEEKAEEKTEEESEEKTEDPSTSFVEESGDSHIIHIGDGIAHGGAIVPTVPVSIVADTGSGSAVERPEDKHVPPSELSAYADFEAPVAVKDTATIPSKTGDLERKYEEESELIRHSKELEAEEKARKIAPLPVYPDPEPDLPERTTGKTKDEIAAERRAMLDFERGYGKGKTPEKLPVDPYAGVGAATLEDEISRGDVTATGDSGAKTEAPVTLKAKPVFDKKSLKKNKTQQIKNDNKVIEQRIKNKSRKLEMEALISELSFDAKGDDGRSRRAKKKIKEQIAGTKKQIREAIKYENEDNARYYHLVLTDVETVKISKKVDREYVRETRSEILALLKKRDEINTQLVELYSLSSGGKVAEGRHKAIQRGMMATHKKLSPIYEKCEKAKVSTADKEKLYALLNERVKLGGELAKINYLIKKEKISAEAKKQARRDRSKIQRKLNENKREIARFERKAVGRAERKNERRRVSIVGWIVLLAIVVAGVLVYLNFDQIKEWVTGML